MFNELEPVEGQWYAHKDTGAMFRVVAVDAQGAVEIQYFDGDVAELDAEAWRESNIEAAEAPEDWTGPFDDLEPDEMGDRERTLRFQDWRLQFEPLGGALDRWPDAVMVDGLEQ